MVKKYNEEITMKNVILIPTKEKSKLCIRDVDGRFCLHRPEVTYHGKNQHMYILCDDAIYTGEWCFEVHNGESKAPKNSPRFTDDKGNIWWLRKANCMDIAGSETTKKIALTTNPYLIFDGIQEITEDFLVWYINNRVDNLNVEYNLYNLLGRKVILNDVNVNSSSYKWRYDIILPSEVLRTSDEWQKIYPDMVVYDPDGWNRKNFQYSWFEELISLDEYNFRKVRSTCMGKIEEFAKQAGTEIKPEDIWNPEKIEGIKKFIARHKYNPEAFKAAEEWFETKKYQSAFPADRQSFLEGAKWQAEQHEALYKSIREFRNELRDRFEDADFMESGQLRQRIKGIDMILTKFEQFNK